MSRRKLGKMNGERFLGNIENTIVHDLDHEHDRCHLDGIIHSGREVPINRLWEAHQAGFNNCQWCIGWAVEPRFLGRDKFGPAIHVRSGIRSRSVG